MKQRRFDVHVQGENHKISVFMIYLCKGCPNKVQIMNTYFVLDKNFLCKTGFLVLICNKLLILLCVYENINYYLIFENWISGIQTLDFTNRIINYIFINFIFLFV